MKTGANLLPKPLDLERTNMNIQQIMSRTRKALENYNMIEDGDNIAIGVSGGKDSLSLLYSMASIQKYYPKKFKVNALLVDLGFENADFSKISDFCDSLEVPFHVIKSDIYEVVFNIRKEKNPCSLCAKLRKGAFNDYAKQLGINKIAYAHHKEDFIETFFLSLIYEGRLNSFKPVTYLDRSDLTLIRPFLYVSEDEIISLVYNYNLPVYKNPCPADGYTKRQYAKELINKLDEENEGFKNRAFKALEENLI